MRKRGPLLGHAAAVCGTSFADASRIVTAGRDETVRVFSLAAQGVEALVLRGHEGPVLRLAWRADGLLASAGEDGTIRLWIATEGRERAVLRGHGAGVNSLAFTPDGRRLASGSAYASVRIWDADSARELLSIPDLGSTIFTLAFSPDGVRQVAGDLDGAYRIFDSVPLSQSIPK